MNLISTRDAYGDSLLRLGDNEKIVVLDADLSSSTQTNRFAKKFPNRFFNVGCAEQNLMGVATGLSINGKIVFASTYAIFSIRAYEQIRTIAHDNVNVKIAVSHSGLTNGPDGASHQLLEDIALMRVIPNMTIIVPCDAIETEKAIMSEIKRKGPTYIRLNRSKTPIIYSEHKDKESNYKFELGKSVKLKDGNDASIITTGTMVHKVLDAAKILENKRIYVDILNIHTIKPIDRESIIKTAKNTGKIITVEEHSIFGGLGGAISEILGEEYPILVKKIGINDVFGESGQYDELLKKHGLTTENIVKKTEELLKYKY